MRQTNSKRNQRNPTRYIFVFIIYPHFIYNIYTVGSHTYPVVCIKSSKCLGMFSRENVTFIELCRLDLIINFIKLFIIGKRRFTRKVSPMRRSHEGENNFKLLYPLMGFILEAYCLVYICKCAKLCASNQNILLNCCCSIAFVL